MNAHEVERVSTLETVRRVDRWAREQALRCGRRVRIDSLRSVIDDPLAFLFVLGVLIFVHELGHFLAARRVGVRVLTFSLGFGPKILKFTRGDTEYCISAIPLGGYVKMAGENPDDPRSGAAGRVPVEDQVAAVPDPDHGTGDEHHPGGRRAGDRAGAGRRRSPPTGTSRPSSASCVPDSPAEHAGLDARAIASSPSAANTVETWEDLLIAIGTQAGPRHRAVACCAAARRSPRDGAAGRRGALRDRRHRRAARHPSDRRVGDRRRPGREGRPQGRRRRPRDQRRADGVRGRS